MKKLICLYIALNIVLTGAFAAPYDFEYLTSGRYALITLMQSMANASDGGKNDTAASSSSDTDKEKPKHRHISEVAAAVAVTDSISYCTYDGEDMKKMTYYVNGGEEKKECYFDSGSYNMGGKYDYDDLTAGSLVYVDLDKNGIVGEYHIVAVFDKASGLPKVDSSVTISFGNGKIKSVNSYILDYRYRNDFYNIELTNGNNISVPSDSYMYTVEPERISVRIHTDTFSGGDVYKAEYRDDLGKTVVYPVISVLYKDEAVFTCTYSTPVYINGDITQ